MQSSPYACGLLGGGNSQRYLAVYALIIRSDGPTHTAGPLAPASSQLGTKGRRWLGLFLVLSGSERVPCHAGAEGLPVGNPSFSSIW